MIKYNGVSTLEVLEGAGNYNKWIASNIIPFIKSPVLEVGAGSGNISAFLIKKKDYTISDLDSGLITHLKQKFNDKKVKIIRLNIEKNPPTGMLKSYNSVFAVNVLEHINKDLNALKNINKVLKKNGKLILLVPANQFAYTRLDKELGHFRRYSERDLVEKAQAAGFEIEKVKFFNILGLVTWMLRDLIEKENIHLKPYQIAAFDRIVPILRFIESKVPVPIGISLILIARKK